MPFRVYLMCRDEHSLDVIGKGNIVEISRDCNLMHEILGIQVPVLEHLLKYWIHLHELLAVKDMPDKGNCEQRLNGRGTVCNYGDCASWRNGCCGGVPHGDSLLFMRGTVPARENPAFLSQVVGFGMGFFLKEAHDSFTHLQAITAVVWYSKQSKQVCESHVSQSYLPGSPSHLLYFFNRELIGVNDIIKEFC